MRSALEIRMRDTPAEEGFTIEYPQLGPFHSLSFFKDLKSSEVDNIVVVPVSAVG